MTWLKEKVAFYLDDYTTPAGKVIEFFLLMINLLACALYVTITYQSLDELPEGMILLEVVLVSVFIVEYVLRFWVAQRKLSFVFSFYGIVDMLSILPIFFEVHTAGFLRLLRVLRILRFTRFLDNENFFFGRLTILQLQVVRTIFTLVTIIFIWAGFINYAETGVEGTRISTFGDAVYFAIVTLSTVGFGDITPSTGMGRLFTALMICSGVILIPWQASRLVQALIAGGRHKRQIICPHCGLKYHEPDADYCKACGSDLYLDKPS